LNTSVLESIKGIGKKKSRALLTAFASLDEIRRQRPEAVARAAAVNLEKAGEVITYLSRLEG
jgi:excinuclease UvrABC nuclease subunit